MAHLREISVISSCAGKVVTSKVSANVIQIILPFTMSCSFQRESWAGTGTFLSGRAMAGMPMQMTQMIPMSHSLNQLLCLPSLSQGGGVQHHLTGGKTSPGIHVDSWAAAEQQHLNWAKANKKKLRAELYTGIVDAFSNDSSDPKQIGPRIILPATFQGSSRNMRTNMQKSLAIAREMGTCDVFLTLTGNADWSEVQEALYPGQTSSDRPELVTCVFEQKKKFLLHLIGKEGILGKTIAHV